MSGSTYVQGKILPTCFWWRLFQNTGGCSFLTARDLTLESDPDLSRRVNIARSSIPAVTHVDSSARIQTVDERHGRFHGVLKAFHEATGCPILVNTSFNLSWEPIVLTPTEAFNTFMQSEMDVLVLERFLLRKKLQPLGFLLGLDIPPPALTGTTTTPWAVPGTGEPLTVEPEKLVSSASGKAFPVKDRIPRLVQGAAVEASSKTGDGHTAAFGSTRDLLERFRRVPLYRLLADQTPFSWRVLEYGCGAGWLSLFLAIAHRSLLGVDNNLPALEAAERFRASHGIARAGFAQTDLLSPGLLPGFFDLILVQARLASDKLACEEILSQVARLLRPNGFVVVVADNAADLQPGDGTTNGRTRPNNLKAWKLAFGTQPLELVKRFPPPWPDEMEASSEDLFGGSGSELSGLSSWMGQRLQSLTDWGYGEAEALVGRHTGGKP